MNDPSAQLDSYDQRLANLMSELGDEAAKGEHLDIDIVCDSHPEFAEDLRALWGTVALTQAIGTERSQGDGSGVRRQPAQILELPYDLGDYLLEEEIGRGGMGIVYLGRRKTDATPVAIKMILKGDFASDVDRDRFDAEAEASAVVVHPNVVPIYEIGNHNGMPFYCMKYIEGQTLAERLARGPLPSRRAAELARAISDAIYCAHEEGVLHRDLKPSNILIDKEGKPFVADFGLAKFRTNDNGSLTKSGAILGTPSYMSPEQAAGEKQQIAEASDVYSLGAILYHMLTGRPPFLGVTPVDTVLMVIEQDPINPRVINRRVHRDIESIALRCLQKPKDLRYSTASALTKDLDAYLDEQPVSAREGRIGQIIGNIFRETHHAGVLENWGLLWMWHSLVLLAASIATHLVYQTNAKSVTFVPVWSLGFIAWAAIFWWLRRRMGPVTFVERQIAHVWAASICLVVFLFPLERSLGLPPLSLAPFLAIVSGMTFVVKAGILSGSFYIHAAALFLCAIIMVIFKEFAMIWFGATASLCFFIPGWKYYRRKRARV